MKNIEKNFEDYLKIRIDIIANDPNKWLGTCKFQLPTFDYYLINCVEYKGGKYDFTKRSYSSPSQTLEPISFHNKNKYAMRSERLYRSVKFSMWMGTSFNYKTIIN
jgi:hypothetical protein